MEVFKQTVQKRESLLYSGLQMLVLGPGTKTNPSPASGDRDEDEPEREMEKK
jgi:hypothetical protein